MARAMGPGSPLAASPDRGSILGRARRPTAHAMGYVAPFPGLRTKASAGSSRTRGALKDSPEWIPVCGPGLAAQPSWAADTSSSLILPNAQVDGSSDGAPSDDTCPRCWCLVSLCFRLVIAMTTSKMIPAITRAAIPWIVPKIAGNISSPQGWY